jgi:hypothetical protein
MVAKGVTLKFKRDHPTEKPIERGQHPSSSDRQAEAVAVAGRRAGAVPEP